MKSTKQSFTGETSSKGRRATQEEIDADSYLVEAIAAYRKKQKISQIELGERLNKSQSHISKRLSHKDKSDGSVFLSDLLTFYEARLICEAMGTSVGIVLQEYEKSIAKITTNYEENASLIPADNNFISEGDSFIPVSPAILFKPHDNLTNNISDPMFKCWFGTYHCYFYSTLSTESNCFHGILNIPTKSSDGCCNVNFDFVYDEKLDRHKKYYGQLILSKTVNGAYCTLINRDDQGEISYLIMANPAIKNKNICCMLALVLTISGGKDTNHPCVERMIISREELNGANFERAKAHLLLNDKYIRISEQSFTDFLRDENVPESFKQRFRDCALPFNFSPFREYVCRMAIIPETWIKSLPGYSEREHQELIDLMRLYSISPKFNKIKQKTAENDIFEMFKDLFAKWNLPTPDDEVSCD